MADDILKPSIFTGTPDENRVIESDLVRETYVALDKDMQSYSRDYRFCFVNTMHMYLRIPVSLFELCARHTNRRLEVVNFVLPSSLLVEDVQPPPGVASPEPGWSRYVQGLAKEEWEVFRRWMADAKWMALDKDGNKILFGSEEQQVQLRDPVKMQTMQVIGIKEFVEICFFLPSNSAGKIYLNLKNGPPFQCTSVTRNGAGAGEALTLFSKLRANS